MISMKYDQSKEELVERHLGELVNGLKGVRKIRGCSHPGFGSYKISFGYQRKQPFKIHLLIYNPGDQRLTLVADGGINIPPLNIRQHLIDTFGVRKYIANKNRRAYHWENIGLDDILNH
ncbi:hypothetical protein HOI26_03440 [Candidatus Woesearchaeota archaeon]|jgi:hypothetical protein|nr:hypothetical protein [Candidatus Woesearchaeota archaeon]